MTPEKLKSASLDCGDWFGRFELRALCSAHNREAEKLHKHAADRRKWAEERGPIWQKYLAAALTLERQARRHRDRARELLLPNNRNLPADEKRHD